jgi:ATP synthase protein I
VPHFAALSVIDFASGASGFALASTWGGWNAAGNHVQSRGFAAMNPTSSMSAPTPPGARGKLEDEYADASNEPPFRSLTHEEALALRAAYPPLSPWRVVAVQAVAGLVSVALWWGVTRKGAVAWSALYGAAAVVFPSALMARGLARQLARGNPGAAVFGFLLWEAVKVAVAVAMLVAAARVVPDLSWPALLVTMIVCLKVNWLALLWRGRVKNKSPRDNR